MKKNIIKCAVIIVLLITLLPFPQKVKREYYGEDIISGSKADISIDMWYLNFLLLKDKMYGEITVTFDKETTKYGEYLSYYGLYPTNNNDKTMYAFGGFRYDADENYMVAGSAYLSRDFSRIAVCDRESEIIKQYIGNTEKNKIEETTEYFKGFIEKN